jgi:hypothetical protein
VQFIRQLQNRSKIGGLHAASTPNALAKKASHQAESFPALGQVVVIPEGVGQSSEGDQFGLVAGAQKHAMENRGAAPAAQVAPAKGR